MPTREEIKGVFDSCYNAHYSDLDPDGLTKCILSGLHSQRCRIEVDRELPSYDDTETIFYAEFIQHDMLKAGYVAVEPLIEE